MEENTIIGLRIRARGTTLVDLPGYCRRGARVGNTLGNWPEWITSWRSDAKLRLNQFASFSSRRNSANKYHERLSTLSNILTSLQIFHKIIVPSVALDSTNCNVEEIFIWRIRNLWIKYFLINNSLLWKKYTKKRKITELNEWRFWL